MKSNSVLKRILPSIIGAKVERNTETFLNKRGLRTIRRNYKCRTGEIDLVMNDGEYVVFVEVRYRGSDAYGDPIESITARKQQRLIRAATHFLATEPHLQSMPCRFDAVGVSKANGHTKYDWIKNAFST